ncbi:peptide chain release factor-like protein [Victivallis vadensis]|uniref:Peptide chain release factor-like protein n=1 Tax=Victivallis vadensis TaxID=172901 RepID=A0A848AN47_9BACT|nr:peptide chain release factor-like protein [Victivallis vadensis]NMD85344.1 peptide chain release factor-like protein [Victivallis vadensis]
MENRDDFLKLDDSALSACCELGFFKGSGNGGQKRNKTSSAVRVYLKAFDLSASDCTERSQHRNRANALAKLRHSLALTVRETPAEPPERMECALNHPAYPLFLAHLLDVAAEQGWELKPAAARLGVTPTALVKLFARDPALWTHVNAARTAAGLPALRRP